MKLLIAGFSESIHTARWINQLESSGWKVYLFPSVDNGAVNKELRGVSVFQSFYGNLYKNTQVRNIGIPVLSHSVAIALRMLLKILWPNFRKAYLRHVVRSLKPEIVHSMEIQHAGCLVSEVKRNWKGKFPSWIATNWGSDIFLFGRLRENKKKIEEVLRSCDYYSCECNRDVLLGRQFGLAGHTLPVFPNSGGFDLEKLKAIRERVKPSQRNAIVVKGYQGWAGRALVALRALERCGELLKGYELIIYSIQPGTGVDLAAKLLAEKYNLKLTLVPLHTPHEQILKYHAQARISVGLSISDAISTMVLEAMVMGSFPIQSNTSCANEWITNRQTGMIVPPEDPEIVEKAIRTALVDNALVDRASDLNWQIAAAKLDQKIIRNKIILFYDEVSNMRRKTFVTGIFGSGKTTFAKRYAKEHEIKFIPFDKIFKYSQKKNQSRQILKDMPDSFVMDAIPIDEKASWADFIKCEKERNDVAVVCVYCPLMDFWLKRIGRRAVHYKTPIEGAKHWAKKILGRRIIPKNFEQLSEEYRRFFTGTLAALKRFKFVKYYDSCANEYTTLDQMQKRINMRTFPFQDYLRKLPDGYDKYYQDIEIIDLKGYSESYKTWESIKDLVCWKGKKVVDLGCSHGYFTFKAEDNGAKAVGLEKSEAVLKTAQQINKLRGGKVVFKQWEGGQTIPPCDVTLCLNVLHHFSDPAAAVSRMRSGRMIFEVYKKYQPVISKYLKILKKIPSRRSKRVILLCEPKSK